MTAARRKHAHQVLTASTNNTRATPQWFFDWIDGQLHFTVDVCANEVNAKHPRFFTEHDNGLAQSWADETVWMNPPYGAEAPQWMAKLRDSAIEDRTMGCALVPARVGVEWWRRYVLQLDGEAGKLRDVRVMPGLPLSWFKWQRLTVGIYFHDTRIQFDGMDTGAPFDAAVIFFGHPTRRPVKPRIVSTLPPGRDWPLLVEGWL